jgi:hypothetical protein
VLVKAHRSALTVLTALAVVVPALAAAQEPVKSFDQLNTRLKPGDTIWVIDTHGREVKGRILRLTPSSLVLDDDQPRSFGAGDVDAVRERSARPIGKAALWGTVAGAGAGVVMALTNRSEYASYCPPDAPPGCWPPPGTKAPVDWWSIPLTAGLGAGFGTVVGALLPGTMRDVYRAPATAPAAGTSAHMSVAPVITPRAKGVAVSFLF